MNLQNRDRAKIWHPFTQEQTAPLPIAIQRAQGVHLYDEQGKSYLDLISSWWVNIHGHAHPDIARSIYEQALKLEHVIFAGFTHEPAVALCEGLSQLLPQSLSRFFFSDNGSTSVEVALKMAYQYWVNQGESGRTLFLSFEGAYHGDTFGAMSVGAHCGFHDAFSKLLFKTLSLPFPSTWQDDPEIADKEQAVLDRLDQILAEQGSQIAALILEPLIQGAAGMRMCRPEFVKTLVERVRAQGILVIFDEVMTGFGRTGTVFALDQVGLAPDLLCVSKGITGGFLPLALTVTTEALYQAFLSPDWPKAFAHGHSYTANPLACAAALASLKILNQPEIGLAMQHIHEAHQAGIAAIKEHCPKTYQHRSLGTIAAFEVHTQDIPRLNRQLKAQFLEAGLLIRPLGNTVYLLPPYCISNTQLQESYHAMIKILNQAI